MATISPHPKPAHSPSRLIRLARGLRGSLYALFNRLIEPRDPLPELERLYARLLTAILYLFLILGIITSLTEMVLGDTDFLLDRLRGNASLIGIILIAISLARSRHHRKSAWGLILILNSIVWYQLSSYQILGVQQPVGLLYILLPLLLAAMLLSWRAVLILWLINVAIGVSLPYWYTVVPSPVLYRVWLVPLLFISAIFLVTAWQRSLFDTRARQLLAQATSRRAGEYFRAVVDRALDMLVVVDTQANLRYVSPTIHEFLGFPLTAAAASQPSDWLPADQYGLALAFFHQLRQQPDTMNYVELRVRHHTGDWRTLEIRGQNLSHDEAVGGYVLHIRDITQSVQAEQARQDALNQLQRLSQRLVDIQESEARRIAHELHDEVGQSLTALKLEMQRNCDPAHTPNAQAALDLVQHILDEIRDLSRDLHPPMLEDLGLVSALRWFLDQQALTSELHIHFSTSMPARLPLALELTCFRIVQEAVTNIIRHAQAENITVRLESQADHVLVRVSDDGTGFDLESAHQRSLRGESLGLFSMQQRVQQLGGRLDIDTEPGEGATVTAQLPLLGSAADNLPQDAPNVTP